MMIVKRFLFKPICNLAEIAFLSVGMLPSLAEPTAPMISRSGAAVAQIVVPASATPVEQSAARELQEHLGKVTGATFGIVADTTPKSGPRLLVGNTAAARSLMPDFDPKAAAYDGIVLKTFGDDLILNGHPQRGALYAVYSFLEDSVGVRWWTSDETFIPNRPTLQLPVLDIRYAPKLRFRESYYLDSFNALFKTRLKGNFSSRTRYVFDPMEMIPEAYGGNH
ncbi:MAG: alpha-glucuronidase family glycosyl hydrolase, partial [Kiritimatiellae bacterium]|nr:alpha-glucuronidase family glycosyl hydrolase [Kiritimatiellia bacterium]